MILTLLTALVLAQSYYSPEEAQALFRQANEAYDRGELDAAQEGYRKLLDRGFGGPDVLYNLGTAHLAEGELGEAVLYLERARREAGPRDDVEAHLAIARSRQLDQVLGAQADETLVSRVVAATSEAAAGWTFIVAWALAFALLIALRFLAPARRLWVALAAGLCFAVAVPAGLLVWSHLYVRETLREAVVMASTAQARELPQEGGKVAFEVHAGLKVQVVDEAGTFVRIRLPNGLEGWTPQAQIAELEP